MIAAGFLFSWAAWAAVIGAAHLVARAITNDEGNDNAN